MLVGCWGAAAATGTDGRIYVFGGSDVNGESIETVQVYDPVTKTWGVSASMPTARSDAAAVAGKDGLIYVIGGLQSFSFGGGRAFSYRKTVEAYDPVGRRWTSVPGM